LERKIQVFISSTYIDLQDERQAAVQAILDAGHIPAGMELFKAGNDSQLDVIKRWICESDAYMLILGGRYGSIEPNSQKSYTHLEYEYALQLHKPIFAVVLSDSLLHKKASLNTSIEYFEMNNITQYKAFKKLVLSKMSRFINETKDIGIAVLSSLYDFLKNPKISGWVREVSVNNPVNIMHKCYKCGKEELLPPEPNFSSNNDFNELIRINRWHNITIDTPGYGSDLDMVNLDFELCDECLNNFINALRLKNLIYGDKSWGESPEDYLEG
jgi:hypothetical protein